MQRKSPSKLPRVYCASVVSPVTSPTTFTTEASVPPDVFVLATNENSPFARHPGDAVAPQRTCGTALALPFWKRESKSHDDLPATHRAYEITKHDPSQCARLFP